MSSEASQVLIATHEGVLTLTLNQPARANALSGRMLQELGAALRAAERDEAVRVIVLTGAGKAFCSGGDISEFAVGDAAFQPGEHLRTVLNPLTVRLRTTEKPVLAAINGVAAGAGLSLALACDLRFAAESARLVVAFVNIGLVPDAGSLFFLPRLVGPGKALELAWTGDPVAAHEAYELGLVNKVLPDDELLAHIQALAARLASGPRKTIGLIKRAINQSHESRLERVLELEASYQTIAARDPNFAEGVAAFKEKRRPHFG